MASTKKNIWKINIHVPDHGNEELNVAADGIDAAVVLALRVLTRRLNQDYNRDHAPKVTSKHITSAVAGAELDA